MCRLSEKIDDFILIEFIKLTLEKNNSDSDLKEKIIFLMNLIKNCIASETMDGTDKFILKNLNQTENIVKSFEKQGLSTEEMFPIKDYTNKGGENSFLPNIDVYNATMNFIFNMEPSKKM